ncbi:pollen Ole e 1 allergen and extensin family protein [Striga asiatica]|uniref:Pollen Ole e 1 allergen and extensin family protein n=1 Tax=Striga asiatica TaxID=4170 RepID=A0A5A7PEK6_STRAF|nr:pollen Ole e 1 allergen and extensin family protein [Striga asiatica]
MRRLWFDVRRLWCCCVGPRYRPPIRFDCCIQICGSGLTGATVADQRRKNLKRITARSFSSVGGGCELNLSFDEQRRSLSFDDRSFDDARGGRSGLELKVLEHPEGPEPPLLNDLCDERRLPIPGRKARIPRGSFRLVKSAAIFLDAIDKTIGRKEFIPQESDKAQYRVEMGTSQS